MDLGLIETTTRVGASHRVGHSRSELGYGSKQPRTPGEIRDIAR
jgi:hypothetical protein